MSPFEMYLLVFLPLGIVITAVFVFTSRWQNRLNLSNGRKTFKNLPDGFKKSKKGKPDNSSIKAEEKRAKAEVEYWNLFVKTQKKADPNFYPNPSDPLYKMRHKFRKPKSVKS